MNILLVFSTNQSFAQSNPENEVEFDLSELEELDDLEALKNDAEIKTADKKGKKSAGSIGAEEKATSETKAEQKPELAPTVLEEQIAKKIEEKDKSEKADNEKAPLVVNDFRNEKEIDLNFDVGSEESKLLELSQLVAGKLTTDEWKEISSGKEDLKYIVQKDEWLWKISEKLFGTGFYYSKIWALNPHITNPHEVEPGMVLTFDSGSSDKMPEVKLGDFKEDESINLGSDSSSVDDRYESGIDFRRFGDNAEPPWVGQRQKLQDEGVFFQYASEQTFEDIVKKSKESLVDEYLKYEPPVPDVLIVEPKIALEDSKGFSKDDKISSKDYKEGTYINTFVSSNIVQDLGSIQYKRTESVHVGRFEKIFIKFDRGVRPKIGDLFSVYSPDGRLNSKFSERVGYRYTIVGHLKVMRPVDDLWECEMVDVLGLIKRGDRVTIYTPNIAKVERTFNPRVVEAAIVDSYERKSNFLIGDLLYLDRGRADGLELGNVFEVFGFMDQGTGKKISRDPSYKIGELTVVTLTDNFATAVVSNNVQEIPLGSLSVTKTQEKAIQKARDRERDLLGGIKKNEQDFLDELDVELQLDKTGQDLLEKADRIQLKEEELDELERLEQEKSSIKDYERDLKALERLESEIVRAENKLDETKIDEDKFLEQQNLDFVEGRVKGQDPNAFESLEEIEKEVGLKYLDEDLNSKENPYGLTEFDIEEIDTLLNNSQPIQ